MTIDLTRKDIGAEIISILTKGMYPDPKDALREYELCTKTPPLRYALRA